MPSAQNPTALNIPHLTNTDKNVNSVQACNESRALDTMRARIPCSIVL